MISKIKLRLSIFRFPKFHKQQSKKLGVYGTFRVIIFSFLIIFIGSLGTSFLIILPLKEIGLYPQKISFSFTSIYIYFLVCLLAPFIEEVIFRLPLIFKRWHFLVSTVLFTIIITKHNLLSAVIISLFVFLIVYFVLYSKKINLEYNIEKLWRKHYTYIFYFYILVFGLIHLSSFQELSLVHYLLSPLLVAPQIFCGLVLSYTRINYKNGFLIAVLLHMLYNSFAVLLNRLH